MKPLFSNQIKKPLLVNMLTELHPEQCLATIRNAIYDGADAFGLHLCVLDRSHHNEKDLRSIFEYMEDRPAMTINYRKDTRSELDDEELARVQLMAVQAGGSMCDIMGDFYDRAPLELTYNPKAIDRQRKLIDQIHNLGGEVLMSSHTWVPMTAEQTLEHAATLASRGADMIKIAMCAHTQADLMEVIRTTDLLHRELPVPFLHVCMGQYGKVHRVIAPTLGSALVLCVQTYTGLSHKDQPLLRAARTVIDNLDWHPARNALMGTRAVLTEDTTK